MRNKRSTKRQWMYHNTKWLFLLAVLGIAYAWFLIEQLSNIKYLGA